MNDPKSATIRERNAALRAEVAAWLEAPEADSTIYENVRVRIPGITRMRDAQEWACRHDLATAPVKGRLLARRTESDPLFKRLIAAADSTPETDANPLSTALLAHLGELLPRP